MGADRPTAVKINNQTYRVLTGNPEHVERLARYVDERMAEVSAQTPTVDSLKVAVLAALYIADDLFAARSELDDFEGKIGKRFEGFIEMLEPFQPGREQ